MFSCRYVKGRVPFFNGGYTKGVPFPLKMIHEKVRVRPRVDLRAELNSHPQNFVERTLNFIYSLVK